MLLTPLILVRFIARLGNSLLLPPATRGCWSPLSANQTETTLPECPMKLQGGKTIVFKLMTVDSVTSYEKLVAFRNHPNPKLILLIGPRALSLEYEIRFQGPPLDAPIPCMPPLTLHVPRIAQGAPQGSQAYLDTREIGKVDHQFNV